MILRTGIDIIEIARIEGVIKRHGNRYLERIYTPAEIEQSGNKTESLAGRFAAKEACAKAIGTGIGVIAWKDVEILGDEQNAPTLKLYGEAAKKAKELGLTTWSISISHNLNNAVAIVVVVG